MERGDAVKAIVLECERTRVQDGPLSGAREAVTRITEAVEHFWDEVKYGDESQHVPSAVKIAAAALRFIEERGNAA